jgi:lipopolysaccharide transport system ATP-binding protein
MLLHRFFLCGLGMHVFKKCEKGLLMFSNEISIDVANLSKCYKIYENPIDRLKQSIFPKFHKLAGLEQKKFYKEFWALRNASFQVYKGETIGIIGKNGSGKSTLLQIICGTLSPTNGTVEVNGRVAALLELGAGFNPEFSGRENVYLNAAILGLSKEEIDSRFDEIITFAEIGGFIDQSVKTYSSGMYVRLAFSVAVHVNPDILIIDEALSVGDELFQRKCFSKIESIKNNGATILFVSHSGSAIVELCDRAILIDAGEKLLEGVPKHIVSSYQKLLYASEKEKSIIREEYKNNINFPLDKSNVCKKHIEISELFDPGLRPSSTIEYAKRGAVITNAHVNLPGVGHVNNLVSGEIYQYIYKVEFTQAVRHVRYGMLIKTVSGVELGGSVSASDIESSLSNVDEGANHTVIFTFRCSLNPGVYFLNAGVIGNVDGEETYLHRLIDVAMFRVLPETRSLATGVVDFEASCNLILDNEE